MDSPCAKQEHDPHIERYCICLNRKVWAECSLLKFIDVCMETRKMGLSQECNNLTPNCSPWQALIRFQPFCSREDEWRGGILGRAARERAHSALGDAQQLFQARFSPSLHDKSQPDID